MPTTPNNSTSSDRIDDRSRNPLNDGVKAGAADPFRSAGRAGAVSPASEDGVPGPETGVSPASGGIIEDQPRDSREGESTERRKMEKTADAAASRSSDTTKRYYQKHDIFTK